MNTSDAILRRRSIRRFHPQPIPRETLECLLSLTTQAPSAKNSQPWRFVVLEGAAKDHLARLMLDKVAAIQAMGRDSGSCQATARIIAQAPATILFLNVCRPEDVPAEAREDYATVMVQSIGGAVQTMLLAAEEMGLGSLWIYDVTYARDQVRAWLRRDERIVAAVTLGYPAEAPVARPRRGWQELTEWRTEEA
jgi:nitroreductase